MVYDYTIIGAGLAGLCAAIDLKLQGASVVLIEKNKFPFHKVCGEYISNEVRPYLRSLGADVDSIGAVNINRFKFSSFSGSQIEVGLDMGGFGISRYSLDSYLWDLSSEHGVVRIRDEVINYEKEENYQIELKSGTIIRSKFLIGAYGKRNKLDKLIKRSFSGIRTPWIGIKAHYKGEHDADLVSLHHFHGGYCGISRVEEGKINVCYLIHTDVFKKFNGIIEVQQNILEKNPNLKAFFANHEMIFDKPLSISQIYFGDRHVVENDLSYIGDAAGMIHPLAGNGMAMAIGSAQLLCNIIKSNDGLNENALYEYQKLWNLRYNSRIKMSRMLQQLLGYPILTKYSMALIPNTPGILRYIISKTHGDFLPESSHSQLLLS